MLINVTCSCKITVFRKGHFCNVGRAFGPTRFADCSILYAIDCSVLYAIDVRMSSSNKICLS